MKRETDPADADLAANWGSASAPSNASTTASSTPASTVAKRRRVMEGASGEIRCVRCSETSKAGTFMFFLARFFKVLLLNVHRKGLK